MNAAVPENAARYTHAELTAAAEIVHRGMAPTACLRWPLLDAALGCTAWVKHENQTPLGAFKVRGGLVYFERLTQRAPDVRGVICATRGNHGQSVAYAASRFGLSSTIVVPHGNSREKNAAMRALGAALIEHGSDFQEAREHAQQLAAERGLHLVPSFDDALVLGVASYALELFDAAGPLDTVYVPIGLGSGICGMIAARDALGLATQIVGVVSSGAPAYARSLAAGHVVAHEVTTQLADGMACRVPEPQAFEIIRRGAERLVDVGDDEIAVAMRLAFETTHNVLEGAGAAATAAALQERERNAGRHIGVVFSGGNIDRPVYAGVLAGTV
ncbi:threonine dehydratase [Solimonas marina]|uniref:Threonine dehydratase n=1 Tax=Solimonas marina TaxID=2714601 RepID=A0A969WAC9_9GAMM|nr:threonine dehydratase [Solimonas marina]NKF22829.1 threonine dehydratase [Solimonas marina]